LVYEEEGQKYKNLSNSRNYHPGIEGKFANPVKNMKKYFKQINSYYICYEVFRYKNANIN